VLRDATSATILGTAAIAASSTILDAGATFVDVRQHFAMTMGFNANVVASVAISDRCSGWQPGFIGVRLTGFRPLQLTVVAALVAVAAVIAGTVSVANRWRGSRDTVHPPVLPVIPWRCR